MKRIFALLLCLALLIACVPTPTEDFVANKAEGRLEGLIEEDAVEAYAPSSESRSLKSRLGAPETLQEELTGKVWGGTMHVNIDAAVEVPDVGAVPVCTIGKKRFSAAEKERLVKSVIGDGPYYNPNRSISERDDLKKTIERYQTLIDELWKSPNGTQEEKERWVKDMEAERNQFVRALQKLEVDETMHPWSGSFSDESISVATVSNDDVHVHDTRLVSYALSGIDLSDSFHRRHAIRTDAERQAAETARAYLAERFETELVPMSISRLEDLDGWDGRRYDQSVSTYYVEFLPQYNGILCYPGITEHGSDTGRQSAGYETDYTMELPSERVFVMVRDGSVVGLDYDMPMEILRTDNENVTLLPFQKIMEIFRSHVFLNYYLDRIDGKDGEETFHVTAVRLCYALTRKADSDEFYLMPVWDFALDTRTYSEDGAWSYKTSCILSINAVDGSVVDRQVGY